MKAIAKFYTLFWIIYYPVCVAFPVVFRYDYSDEILTVLLVLYASQKSKYLVKDKRRYKEVRTCIMVISFYFIYSLLIQVTTIKGVVLDVMQQIRPYAVFYLTWLMAPKFTDNQKKLIKYVMLISFGLFVVAYFVNPKLVDPFLANEKGSELISGESAPLGQIALGCAMTYYLFSKKNKKNRNIAIFIMLVGLLSAKSKYIGECIAFIALVGFVKYRIRFDSARTFGQIAILGAVIIFFTWTKFDAYYVTGMRDSSDKARPMSYKTAGKIIFEDYVPFGSGLGSFGTAAAAKEYSPLYYKYHLNRVWGLSPDSPMFLADAFYPTLAEIGIVGIFFFLAFWRRRIREAQKIPNLPCYQMAFMCILALALESTADTSYLSGKGMGYFMILAICLNSAIYPFEEEKEKKEESLLEMRSNPFAGKLKKKRLVKW